ncbi:MAG: helix-turn-helix domain-containing protein [Candidatus Roizmanbacteria bacterium]|nr:helix-turn-helix domain-containing protein [Candidatus Roizmanbacteria bacterium]
MSDNAKGSLSLQEMPDLLTIDEVARLLRVSKITLKRWGKKGKLPAIRINSRGDRRYKKEEVLRFLGMKSEL